MRLEKTTKGVEKLEKESVQRLSQMEEGDNDHYGSSSDDDTIGMSGKQQVQEDAVKEERRQEIQQMQNSMSKVNEIYRDLGNLVEEQQYEIDDIENNIMASHTRTEAGMGQLMKAGEFQKSSSRCISWLLVLVVIAAVVCIGILYGKQIFKKD